jgi:hypothetical protein
MNRKVKSESVTPVAPLNRYNNVRSNRGNNNGKGFESHPYSSKIEPCITMFGHVFTISELEAISIFSNKLQAAGTTLLSADQSIPDGSIFIMKVINHEMNVSFGGLLKK